MEYLSGEINNSPSVPLVRKTGCIGYADYVIASDLFSFFWDLFDPPQFHGSLLPRPSELGGLGTSPIGMPNQNLSVQQLLGGASTSAIPSPGLVHP